VGADLALLTTEVVTNAVRHGPNKPGDEILVRLVSDGDLRVEVVSPGPGFERRSPVKPDADRVHGWGLYLLDALASCWGVESDGDRTTVWFELTRER
jgi:anti-sigma regulatory factor (Ser/Thr protein kinase)